MLLSNHAWLTGKTLLVQVILRYSIVYIIFWPLKLRCMKTTCSISFKLTAFNNDSLSFFYINYQSNWISFKVTINSSQYWLSNTIGMFSGLVRVRYNYNFSKILILSGQTIDFYILDIAHVLLFTLTVFLSRLAPFAFAQLGRVLHLLTHSVYYLTCKFHRFYN